MKKIHLFLLLGGAITIALLISFMKPTTSVEEKNATIDTSIPKISNPNNLHYAPLPTAIIDQTKSVKNSKNICSTYGPLSSEQKSSLEEILSQNKFSKNNIRIEKATIYEVYWNLGKDKVTAVELFENQKNEGALQESKYKMKQDFQGNWTVPIAMVANDIEMAKSMSIDLRSTSKVIGGRWQYRNRGEGYYYQIKSINELPKTAIETINNNLNELKTACK